MDNFKRVFKSGLVPLAPLHRISLPLEFVFKETIAVTRVDDVLNFLFVVYSFLVRIRIIVLDLLQWLGFSILTRKWVIWV
jgi:hypothetical protein